MGRPREFDVEAALDQAVAVFWEKGYEATSIEDLLQRMAINRGSLYSAFGSKAQLFLAVLDRYGDRVVGALMAYLDRDPSARHAIAGFFDALCEHAIKGGPLQGCLVTNSAVEKAHADPAVAAKVAALLGRIEAAFEATLRRGLSGGEFVAGTDVPAVARFLTSSMQGVLVMSKVTTAPAVLRDIVITVLRALPDRGN